ncbi:MAG: methylenetetrahydrofolate reductase [Chloroflexi bacterium]|nr:methylenetetrahydrofolate reductase [Chloroflexota bacterium]
MTFQERLESGKFVVTTEFPPPKGTDISRMQQIATAVAGWVDAANVTDNQRAVVRLSPLGAAHILQGWGIEPIMQMTCRDRNRLAIQSDLLSAAALGITNVLAMTGDYITMGDHPTAKAVFDLDSVQLVSIIHGLNGGHDLVGNALDGAPNFFIGVVANPGVNPVALQVLKLKKKIQAGARFIQTQAIYDVPTFKEFMSMLDPDVKVIAGVIPLRSVRMATFMNENVPGIKVPPSLMARMESAAKPQDEGISIAVELLQQLREVCAGVHVMAIGMERYVPTILEMAGFSRR